MTGRDDDEERAESRRILKRVSQEAEAVGGRLAMERVAGRARDHLSAKGVDRGDWAEYWGTRIGRALGALFLLAMIVWLVLFLARPAGPA